MVTHVVMFNMKNKEEAPKLAEIIRSMDGVVPELKKIEVGVNTVEAQRNYDIILITRFDSWEDMEKYAVNDYHVNTVIKAVKEMTTGSVACDFES